MTPKLPKIAKPRPVKWGEPTLVTSWHGDTCRYYVRGETTDYKTIVHGPVCKTKAAAIAAWNKQEGEP